MSPQDGPFVDMRKIAPATTFMPKTRSGATLFLPFRPLSATVATGVLSGASWWLEAGLEPICLPGNGQASGVRASMPRKWNALLSDEGTPSYHAAASSVQPRVTMQQAPGLLRILNATSSCTSEMLDSTYWRGSWSAQ